MRKSTFAVPHDRRQCGAGGGAGGGGGGQEKPTIYLPSTLPDAVRELYGMQEISQMEVDCRIRLAVQCVINIQEAIRNLDALGQYKDINDRGQEQNTQSNRVMNSYKRMRDALIEDYGRHRAALISLGALLEGSSDSHSERYLP